MHSTYSCGAFTAAWHASQNGRACLCSSRPDLPLLPLGPGSFTRPVRCRKHRQRQTQDAFSSSRACHGRVRASRPRPGGPLPSTTTACHTMPKHSQQMHLRASSLRRCNDPTKQMHFHRAAAAAVCVCYFTRLSCCVCLDHHGTE